MNSANKRKGLKLAAQLNVDAQYAIKLAASYFNQEVCDGGTCEELRVVIEDIIATAEDTLAILPKKEQKVQIK